MSILDITRNRFERLAAEENRNEKKATLTTPKQQTREVVAGRSSHRNDFASDNNRGLQRKSRSDSCPPPQATDPITWSTPSLPAGGLADPATQHVPEMLGARARGSFDFGHQSWANKPSQVHFAGRPGFQDRSCSPRSVRRVGYAWASSRQNLNIFGQQDSNVREQASDQQHQIQGFEQSYSPRMMKHRGTMRRCGQGLNGHEDVYDKGQREFTSGDAPASEVTQRLNDRRAHVHVHKIAPRPNVHNTTSEDLAHCLQRPSSSSLPPAASVLAEESCGTPRSSGAGSKVGPQPDRFRLSVSGVGRVGSAGGVFRTSAADRLGDPQASFAVSESSASGRRSPGRASATSPRHGAPPAGMATPTPPAAPAEPPSPPASSASSVASSSMASLGMGRPGSRFSLASPTNKSKAKHDPPSTPKLRLFRDPREP